MNGGVEVCRPGGGSDLRLWRRVTAADSAVSVRTAGPPARSAAPLPLGTSDPTDINPARIELDGSQWAALRVFLKIPTLNADKTARVQLMGYHGDGKHSGLLLSNFDAVVALATGSELTFEPGTGKAADGWYEVGASTFSSGLADFVAQADGGSAVVQCLTYVSLLDCTVLTARITSLTSGITEARLYGTPAGRPRAYGLIDI